jgi:hypothetical protein
VIRRHRHSQPSWQLLAPPNALSRLPVSTGQVLTLLADNPPRIAALTAGLTSVQRHTAPGPDEWSANEVLAHLRSCADVWGGYIRKMIDQDSPSIRAISPRTWIKRTNYRDLEFQPSYRAFAAQRADLLALLEALSPGDWSRTATVTRSGKVVTETVLSYAERLAVHEQHHLEQFAGIANAMHA